MWCCGVGVVCLCDVVCSSVYVVIDSGKLLC